MLALREEVEQEYADRMEELRNMYRTEMDTQTETFEREREKFKQLESSMSETLKLKRHEAEEYKSKYNYCKKNLVCIVILILKKKQIYFFQIWWFWKQSWGINPQIRGSNCWSS